jgi:type II secretory pathway pseudopilin PulG
MEKGCRGSSLVEILIALLLLSIGVVAAAPMFVTAMRENAAGADIGSAGAMAVARLETLRSGDFDDLIAGGSVTTDVAGYFDASDPDFIVRWEILDSGGPAGIKSIAVRATARRITSGLPKSVELTTIRAR